MRKVVYGKKEAEVTSASGVEGILLRDTNNKFYFRVYNKDKTEFVDYEILHDDLKITISPEELASFYRIKQDPEDLFILDHRPEDFGLKEI